jgi:hypothetical protein
MPLTSNPEGVVGPSALLGTGIAIAAAMTEAGAHLRTMRISRATAER